LIDSKVSDDGGRGPHVRDGRCRLDVSLPSGEAPETAKEIVAAAHKVCQYSNAREGTSTSRSSQSQTVD